MMYIFNRNHRQRILGKYGISSERMFMRKSNIRKENYSVSLLSVITQERVVATQLIEGGIYSTVFEQFIQNMLMGIRNNPEYNQRTSYSSWTMLRSITTRMYSKQLVR